VATRGSFASDQAVHASSVLASRYPVRSSPPPGLTVLFEIILPRQPDRGGLPRAGRPGAAGAVDIATGVSTGPETVPRGRARSWSGSATARCGGARRPARNNREGLVVHVPATDARVKIKYDEYVQLHGSSPDCPPARCGSSSPRIAHCPNCLERLPDRVPRLGTVPSPPHWRRRSPPDLHCGGCIRIHCGGTAGGLLAQGLRPARGGHPERGCLFLRLDGKSYVDLLWPRVRPEVARVCAPARRRRLNHHADRDAAITRGLPASGRRPGQGPARGRPGEPGTTCAACCTAACSAWAGPRPR
jgi:RNA ligase